jgi:hypothetical protein
MQMPPDANIPYEWQVGIDNGRLVITFPSWGQSDKLTYAVFMDLKTRELRCECKGFEIRGDCHHVRLLAFCCVGPRHKKKGVQPTSIESFKLLQESIHPHQKTVLKTLRELGRASNKQISMALGWPINTITPRVKELREIGLVDYEGEQFDSKTQRHEMVWGVV